MFALPTMLDLCDLTYTLLFVLLLPPMTMILRRITLLTSLRKPCQGCHSTPSLRQADVLSLHAPLTPATRGLLNAERLGWLKPSAVLVNLGRGGLIELPALVEALRRGALAGAALDVLDHEPPGAELEALKEVPNLILTPHIGWASRQARQRLVEALAEALESEIGSWG